MLSGAAPGNQNVLRVVRRMAAIARRLFSQGTGETGQRIKRPSRVRIFLVLISDLLRHLVGDWRQRDDGRAIFRFFQRFAHLLPQEVRGVLRPRRAEQRFRAGQQMQREISRDRGQ